MDGVQLTLLPPPLVATALEKNDADSGIATVKQHTDAGRTRHLSILSAVKHLSGQELNFKLNSSTKAKGKITVCVLHRETYNSEDIIFGKSTDDHSKSS